MPRPDTSGKTVFFTVALKDRSSDLLTREIVTLRHVVAETRRSRPFQIDAWVVLPITCIVSGRCRRAMASRCIAGA